MKKSACLFLLLLCMAMTACSGDSKEKTDTQDGTAATTDDNENETADAGSNGEPANMQEAMEQAQKAIKDAGVQQVEPVNFRELQELLPDKLSGFERTSKGGETAGALGMKISKAEGKYKNSDGKTVDIDVIDGVLLPK